MFKRAFKEAVCKYLNTTFPSEANRAKDEIIKTVNAATDSDAREQIQEIRAEFGMLTGWIKSHFTPGSLYTDRGLVFGWWREDQLQAEFLPVALSKNYLKSLPRQMEVVACRDGFLRPVDVPFFHSPIVRVPDGQLAQYARYGWANAVPLQWRRIQGGYIVDLSIVDCGFWAAWKWWPGAGNFYENNPPYPMAESFDYSEEPARDF